MKGRQHSPPNQSISWQLAVSDCKQNTGRLNPGDYVQVRFQLIDDPSGADVLWSKVIEYIPQRREYCAKIDESPKVIVDMPKDYQFMFRPRNAIDFIKQNHDGLVLVGVWARHWGKYKKFNEEDFPIQTSMTQILKIHELGVMGDGCYRGGQAIRQINQGISYKDKDSKQVKFDKAWKLIGEMSKRILWFHYVSGGTLMEKVNALGISVHDFFPTLRAAKTEVLSVISRNGDSHNG